MKNILITSAVCASVCLGLSSCDDFLTTVPNDAPTKEVFWQSEEDVTAGTNGMYWLFRDVIMSGEGNRVLVYGDQPVGMWNNLSAIDQSPSTGAYEWTFNNANYTDWSQYYKTLNVANIIINTLPTLDWSIFGTNEAEGTTERNVYIGEALFVRSYVYFFMVRLWGEVPYITNSVSDVSETVKDIPMNSEEEILNNCLDDLDKAYNYLSWDDTHGVSASKANRGAVQALRAHILMWKNRKNKDVIDPQNYRDAIAAIEDIENSHKYELVPMDNYLTIWNDGKSSETIFEFPYSRGDGEKFSKWSIFSKLLGYPMNTDSENGSVYKYTSSYLDIIDKYTANGDRRRVDCWDRWGEENYQYTKKYSSITYLDVDKVNWEMDNTFVLFRLSDMYLLKAEAYDELGEYDNARAYLRKIHERAGISEDVTNNIQNEDLGIEICEERMRELYLEGHNLYDWVRNGEYGHRNGYTQERYEQEGYLWPVCSTLIIDNKYARQTPYWSDKLNL